MEINKIDWPRPDVRDLFLLMACINSLRSPDAQTQCGCLLTALDNRIIGAGYNGFPRGLINEEIPNLRPDKYQWVNSQHSERNAVNNCVLSPKQVGGGIAYVSGNCCFDCTCHLWNNHIDTIYEVVGFSNPVMCVSGEDEDKKRQLQQKVFRAGLSLEIIKVTPNMIGPIFRKEQLIKIVNLFAKNGFDYSLQEGWENIIG